MLRAKGPVGHHEELLAAEVWQYRVSCNDISIIVVNNKLIDTSENQSVSPVRPFTIVLGSPTFHLLS
jgi:hypothetical protein